MSQGHRGRVRYLRSVDLTQGEPTDLGDIIVALLASTLAGLRDKLAADGFAPAAELVSDLVEITEDYLTRVADPAPDG